MDAPELEYVGFWLRFWAFIIDSVLVMVILLPILHAYGAHSYWPGLWPDIYAGVSPTAELIQWVLPAVAVVIFWLTRQATPGKMAISATIVDAATGKRPTTGQFIGRYLAYYVSTLAFFLGFVWIAFDARKQGWHDKLAGTVVVRPRRGAGSVHFTSQ
ncbi:MAG TPA: RDD family protein [Steroidobacteraceae bacterium]